MNKVLDIQNRLKDKKRKQREESYGQRIRTVCRVVQCSSCHFRCSMCGHHLIETELSRPRASSYPDLSLCEDCRVEFEDFLEMSRERGGSFILWHNKEWMKLWSAWLDYQQAIREFRNSTEFKLLTREPDN
jgi:hypothetical protein